MKRIVSSVIGYIKKTDKLLYGLLLVVCVFGMLAVAGVSHSFSSSNSLIMVQGLAFILGFLAIIVVSNIDYRLIARMWKLYVPVVLILVLLTFFIGGQRGTDDKAWLLLPGGMSLQPSELLKIAFILTFSFHLDRVHDHINRPFTVLLLCLHGAFPVLLIHFQGDDGTALVFFSLFLMMLFCAGISWKYILASILAVGIAAPLIWLYAMNEDQKQRILLLFHPGMDPLGVELQQNAAKISIGSGQVWGTGLFTGEHRYVPEIQNDFIFSFIGEALGFVGCIAVLLLLTLLCVKILLVAKVARDYMGKSLCVGVFAMIATQTILNVGMNLSLLPVIGVTLPFFSTGGTSVVTLMVGVGLVFSVYMHNTVSMFESGAPKKR